MQIKTVLASMGSTVFCAMLVLACTAPDAGRPDNRVTVRDSAGVRILTYPAGPFTDTVSSGPLLTIGQEGEPDYEFFHVTQVLSLGTGNVVVANGGTHEIRFYGPGGNHLKTIGGRGGGPEEFGFLSTVWLRTGDTLAVMDSRRRRIVYFDSTGFLAGEASFAGDLPTQPPQSIGPCAGPGLMGLMDDGTRVVSGWGCMQFEGSDGRRPSLVSIELVRPEGRVRLGEFTAMQIWERASSTDPRNSFSVIPFLSMMAPRVGQHRIYISEGAAYEIKVFDADGRLVRLLRENAVPPEVTQVDEETYLAEQAATGAPHPDDVPFPDRFGSYYQLKLSHEGDLWARRYPRPGDEVQHWVVFPAEGEEIRRVVVPELEVMSVREGRLYGCQTDSLGIQTVVVLDAGR